MFEKMKYYPSEFFANFSLSKLVGQNNLQNTGSGVGGGGGSCTFGSIGGAERSESRHSKSESHSFQADPGRADLNTASVLATLKADLEVQLTQQGASFHQTREQDPASFTFEYDLPGISGHIEISATMGQLNSCNLQAKLQERSTSTKKVAVARMTNKREPKGNYYVVPFPRDGAPGAAQAFDEAGQKGVRSSMDRLRQKLKSEMSNREAIIRGLPNVEVYVWTALPPALKEQIQELWGEEIQVPAEYDQYEKVFFLNEVALRMYREIGEQFQILKIIPAAEVAKIPGPSLSGPYLPADEKPTIQS
jgi:hypothetical protein